MGRRHAARRGCHAARHRPGDAGAQPLGRAAVAAAGSQRLRRRERALARRPDAAPRHRQSVRAPPGRGGRSPRGVRAGARAARFDRYAANHLARRKPPAGARAPVHGARIPAPMTPASTERGEPMTFNRHAATRRELLIASGTLFAWAYLPKVARAEGRDPRLLVFVLRGALDGLAAVAPVGDPDWVALRGDKALTLDGKPPALPLDAFFALNRRCPTCIGSTNQARRRSCTRRRRLTASAPTSTVRTCWKAASASRARPTPAGSTARSPRCSRPAAPAARATPSPSDRSRRWSWVDPRPSSLGRRGDCRRRAMTR